MDGDIKIVLIAASSSRQSVRLVILEAQKKFPPATLLLNIYRRMTFLEEGKKVRWKAALRLTRMYAVFGNSRPAM